MFHSFCTVSLAVSCYDAYVSSFLVSFQLRGFASFCRCHCRNLVSCSLSIIIVIYSLCDSPHLCCSSVWVVSFLGSQGAVFIYLLAGGRGGAERFGWLSSGGKPVRAVTLPMLPAYYFRALVEFLWILCGNLLLLLWDF